MESDLILNGAPTLLFLVLLVLIGLCEAVERKLDEADEEPRGPGRAADSDAA